MRLLLIEDDQDLADAIISGLKQKDIQVEWLPEGKPSEYFYPNMGFDIIILDLGLPNVPGLKVLQSIRKSQLKIPVIVLTANDSTEDCIEALNSGADDYMTKPFDLNELVARIHALVRRYTGRVEIILKYKNLNLNPIDHTVTLKSKEIYLPRREFFLLQKFLENIGKVISRESLMQSIYSWDEEVDSNTLEVHIHNIRKKFDFLALRTIRGIGYILEKDKS